MTHPDGTPDAERPVNPSSTADATMALPEAGDAQPVSPGQYGWVPAPSQPAPASEAPTTALPVPAAPAAAPRPSETPTAALPVSEPPYSPEPPISGTPYAPTPPMSGMPYAPPVSGMPYAPPAPGWGQPFATGPAVPPPPGLGGTAAAPSAKRGPLVPILAVLSALLFLSTTAMGVLFVLENSANNRARKTISQRDSALSERTAELGRMRGDLQKANDDLSRAKTDLTGSKNQADELKRQKAIISKCFALLDEVLTAASNGDKPTVAKKEPEMNAACREADRYLN
ncbi:MAG TPA: hypothetical protein VGP31_13975 [Planosporangium sp.]|nr:hypothetical protein [Planosporangium sp.]